MNQEEADRLRTQGVAMEIIERLSSEHPAYSWLPHKKQQRLMLSKARIRAMVASNRVGKSEVVAKICVERLLGWSPCLTRITGKIVTYGQPQRIWVVSPDANVSRDVMEDKVRMFIPPDEERLMKWNAGDRTWKRKNGSMIGFKSADSGRSKFQGVSRHLIALDEEIDEDVFSECFARLLDVEGDLLLSMTALKGEKWLHNFLFLDEYNLEPDIVSAGMIDNPHLPESALVTAKKKWHGDEYRIRVLGEFILRYGRPFFEREILDPFEDHCTSWEKKRWIGRLDMDDGKILPVRDEEYGRLHVYRTPRPDRSYAIGADVSSGEAKDYSTIQVIDTATWEQVATWKGRVDPGIFGDEHVYRLASYYNTATVGIEINGFGSASQLALERRQYGMLYRREMSDRVSETGKVLNRAGWWTDKRTKKNALSDLKDAIRDRSVQIHDIETLEELRCYGYLRQDDGAEKSLVATSQFGLGALNGHDDLVMALAIAIQVAYQAGAPPGAESRLTETIGDVLLEEQELAAEQDVGTDFWDDSW